MGGGTFLLSPQPCCLWFTVCFTAVADFSRCVSITVFSVCKIKAQFVKQFDKLQMRILKSLILVKSSLVGQNSGKFFVFVLGCPK